MRVAFVLLCNYAVVNDNLLTVVGGAVNTITAPGFPAAAAVMAAVAVSASPTDRRSHRIDASLLGPDGDEVIVALRGGFSLGRVAAAEPLPGLDATVPLVFDFRFVPLPAPGLYAIRVLLDGRAKVERKFQARQLAQ